MTNRLTASLLALAMAAPVIAAAPDASAHPAPYEHYHTHQPRVYVPAPVYVRPAPVYVAPRRAIIIAPPPIVIVKPRRRIVITPPPIIIRRPARVIVQRPPPRIIVQAPPPVVLRRRHVRKKQAKKDKMYIGIGIRATTTLLDGFKLGLAQEENSPMGGVGLQLKARFTRHWGLEVSADFMGGGGEQHTQFTVPVMAAITYHFMPKSRFQPYMLLGAGVHFTSLDYLDGRYKIDLVEAAGQVGVGAELFITKWLSLGADLRFQFVFKNIDTQARIREDCLRNVGEMTGFCNGIQAADPDDKLNVGLSFQLGANIYF